MSIITVFHGHEAVAPLKPVGPKDQSNRHDIVFHGHEAVAPLKLKEGPRRVDTPPRVFHGHEAVAPLKHSSSPPEVAGSSRFPRSLGRGSIEARQPSPAR